jgi:nicotinate phosphoribosyltransferase
MDQNAPLIPGHEAILDRLIGLSLCAGPIEGQTDKYFTNTSRIVAANGDSRVTFAVFMRRRVVAALEPAIRLIRHFVPDVEIRRFCAEGDIVPSESKMLEITGSMQKLSEIETLMLQKIGFPCVAANNAYEICRAIPSAAFMDMHARHGSGAEMNILAAYGAAVGSAAAKRADSSVKGFVGSSQDMTAPFFGASGGMGDLMVDLSAGAGVFAAFVAGAMAARMSPNTPSTSGPELMSHL